MARADARPINAQTRGPTGRSSDRGEQDNKRLAVLISGRAIDPDEKDRNGSCPDDRVYTVMSGVFYIGLGDQFDGDKVEAYSSGLFCLAIPPPPLGKVRAYVTQVMAIGAIGFEDRPRFRARRIEIALHRPSTQDSGESWAGFPNYPPDQVSSSLGRNGGCVSIRITISAIPRSSCGSLPWRYS
jgi:hypothetical protein